MSKKIGIIDMQTKGEPFVVGYADNYADDQLICVITAKQAKEISEYVFATFNGDFSENICRIELDSDVQEYIKRDKK